MVNNNLMVELWLSNHTMLVFVAFLLICMAGHLSTGYNLMKSTCMLVQILCFPLANLGILPHILVPFEADRILAVLSNLSGLSNPWLNCLPGTTCS